MGNTRNTGYLQNAIKVADNGNISLMHGSTMLMQISSSGAITTTGVISGSNALSASFAATASFVTLAQTSSFVANAQSASNAVSAQTASFANALTVAGTLTAQTLVVQTITSSVDFVTGSTRFGQLLTNTHVFSGSVSMNPGGLFVSSSGLVGIGTTSPAYALDVVSSTSGNLGRFFYTDGTYNPRLQITGDSTGITFYESYSTGADSIKFSIAGSNTLILKGDNVGIGITSPNNRLSVNGNADFGTTSYPFNGPSQYGGLTFPRGQIFFSNTNTQNQLYIAGNAYNNASGVFAYRNSSQPATAIGLDNGAFSFLTAGNGTADATISWTTVMAITNGGDITMGGTGAIKIQSGTTAQRPSAATGQIRYNTSFNFLEYYDGSNWVPVVGQTSPGSSASNPAESANEIKNYNPNATNGLYWIRQVGTVPVQAYCVFTDYTGAAIQGGPWTVPFISNDANTNFSTDGPTAAATFLSKCQAIGIASPGRGMENTRTTTEVYGAWLAVKRALWNNYAAFIENGTTGGGAVLRMPMVNINGAGGTSDQRLVYNTSLGTHLPPNIDGDACNANQLFCGWWAGTDISGWRVNNNAIPGSEDWNPSDTVNGSYSGAGIQSALTVCVYK